MTAPRSLRPDAAADKAAARRVASIVAANWDMPYEGVLFRKTRGGAIEARARLELYWLLHAGCGMTFARIGAALSRRDKSTIKSGVEQIEEALADGYAHRMERLAALAKELVAIGALQDEALAKETARGRP